MPSLSKTYLNALAQLLGIAKLGTLNDGLLQSLEAYINSLRRILHAGCFSKFSTILLWGIFRGVADSMLILSISTL